MLMLRCGGMICRKQVRDITDKARLQTHVPVQRSGLAEVWGKSRGVDGDLWDVVVWSVLGRVEHGSLYVLIGGNDKEDAGVSDLRP